MVKTGAMTIQQKPKEKAQAPTRPIHRAYTFFEDVKAEFRKITWTEGNEVATYAKAVVYSTFTFGLLIYFADLFINRVIGGMDAIFKLIV